jgi:hypothetical protein
MPEGPRNEKPDDDICVHIFTVSAAMVGVCLTVIGIFRLIVLQSVSTIGDDLLAFDSMAFLVSMILAYVGIRAKGSRHKKRVEKAADIIFIVAICFMVFICALIAYEMV